MKKKAPASDSAFLSPRTFVALASLLCAFGLSLFAAGIFPGNATPSVDPQQDRPGSQKPDIVKVVGAVSQNLDLDALPYIPPTPKEVERRLTRHNWEMGQPKNSGAPNFFDMSWAINPSPLRASIPAPSISFDGVNSTTSGCGCLPPDTNGDVGPNHYVQSVNAGIRVFNKTTGAALTNFTSYNSFFSALGAGNPCGNNNNDGDGIAFYDHIADRWVVSDFAFPAFPGTAFYQCIGVSKTSSPVSGGWWLYAIQVDPTNPANLGDYPKFGLWPDGYYLTMNLFSDPVTFSGVRVYALDRTSMLSGGPANAVGFTISPATLGSTYSLLPATFRFGPPPSGAAEYLLAIDSTDNTVQNTAVYAWRFHADFVTPANSTLGVGGTHAPNATMTVSPFYDAVEGSGGTATTNEVPQLGTIQRLDTLGDKLMYPLYYQNLGGAESLWAVHTVNTGSNVAAFTNLTAVSWYQFDVTGGILPAVPAQQQVFTNSGDGLWRFMPSLALDFQGNLVIGYSVSSSVINPAIRYAGRLAADAASSLAQGENTLIQGLGDQTSVSGRWGDYSTTAVDVSDSCTFYHTNEYYPVNSTASWATRVGAFKYATCTNGNPTPTPTPTGTPTPTPTPPPAYGVILTPTPGSTLPSSSVTFTWSAGSATAYMLLIGDQRVTEPGGSNIFNSGQTGGHSIVVSNIPTDGRTIYVRLWSRINGIWYNPPQDYTYTANPAGVLTPGIAPVSGTYYKSVKVNIATATPGATIYYTTNGTTPTTSSTLFVGPFTLTGPKTVTVKAKAFKSGVPDSAVASAVYTIK